MISPILDVEEPMNGEYVLEVSSPGIERKLKKKEHFICSVGEKVKVKDFSTDVFKGTLIAADEDKIVIQTEFGEEELTPCIKSQIAIIQHTNKWFAVF